VTAPSSEIFTDAATLKPASPERFDAAFTGVTQPCPWPKAYGGDLVAQAAVAAQRTVDDAKALHSMHSYFMRPADIGAGCSTPSRRSPPGTGGDWPWAASSPPTAPTWPPWSRRA